MKPDSRRRFLGRGLAACALGLGLPSSACSVVSRPHGTLRPPGAAAEREFLGRCIRCGRCGVVCPVGAILFGDSLGKEGATPYIDPLRRACVLCMRCTNECPTSALSPIADSRQEIRSHVRMGIARIDSERCWARRGGGICRACWYACPFADEAITLDDALLRPRVVDESCVGCGLCAQACPSEASAMTVEPA